MQARNAAVRAAAAVRALTGAPAPQAAEAAVSGSAHSSPVRGGHARCQPGTGIRDGIQAELDAGTQADRVSDPHQAVAMDIEAGPHDSSSGMQNTAGQASEQAPQLSAPVTASEPADVAVGAGPGGGEGAAAPGPPGTAEEGAAAVWDVEPASLVDGRPPEQSWLPRRGTGAGRVDLYRVKWKL